MYTVILMGNIQGFILCNGGIIKAQCNCCMLSMCFLAQIKLFLVKTLRETGPLQDVSKRYLLLLSHGRVRASSLHTPGARGQWSQDHKLQGLLKVN